MINTMDAMLGYMDERRWIGHFAAKLDDLANYIPARITGLLLLFAAKVHGLAAGWGFRMMIRDHFLTPSPNGGWPMAAMAGVLRVQIEKPGVYKLGDSVETAGFGQLSDAWQVARTAGYLGFIFYFATTGVIYVLR